MKAYRSELTKAMMESLVNTEEMINRGLKVVRAEESPFLPSPGQFCTWCKPTAEDAGMPALEDAFKAARQECGKSKAVRSWPHDAVYVAAQAAGFYDLRSTADTDKGFKHLKSKFERAYKEVAESVISGREIKDGDKVPALPKPEKYEPTSKVQKSGEKAIGSILAMLNEPPK